LHEQGFFERHDDPDDRRRAYIGLSVKGREAMRRYVSAVKRAGLGIA
jgi:DNA-binding MarR family transcriptional regulator